MKLDFLKSEDRNRMLTLILFLALSLNMSWLALFDKDSQTDTVNLASCEEEGNCTTDLPTTPRPLRSGDRAQIRIANRLVQTTVEGMNLEGRQRLVVAINLKSEFSLSQAQVDRLQQDCVNCDRFFFRNGNAYIALAPGAHRTPDITTLTNAIHELRPPRTVFHRRGLRFEETGGTDPRPNRVAYLEQIPREVI